jgi:hypothetical protein
MGRAQAMAPESFMRPSQLDLQQFSELDGCGWAVGKPARGYKARGVTSDFLPLADSLICLQHTQLPRLDVLGNQNHNLL